MHLSNILNVQAQQQAAEHATRQVFELITNAMEIFIKIPWSHTGIYAVAQDANPVKQ